jgi:two-component system sensor histidine kinase ChiS
MTSAPSDNNETVLIVDDKKTNLQILRESLDGQSYKLLVAMNGESALSISKKVVLDLILLDIMMPGMDGYEVCKKLKEENRTKDIPVIFVTAMTGDEDEARGLALGAVDYITKPINPDLVRARVRSHLALKKHRDHLEVLVGERTNELAELIRVYERFVPREFLSLLNKESILQISLGDQVDMKMTVMFADIRGWTTLSESMTPQENFNFINAYLGRVSPMINKHKGFIDQYYGDGVMALFPGTPDHAVRAAIAMHRAVGEYNEERKKHGLHPIHIGIGLHTGNLMLGIIGSQDRMQGAVVADAVNLAARVEGLTRIYGSTITLSDSTFSQLEEPGEYKHRFVDKVQVKGKREPVSVYEVFDADLPSLARFKEETKEGFEEGLRLYYDKKFAEASVYFNQVSAKSPEDGAARIYLERSAKYMVQGVRDSWTGVETLDKKQSETPP